MKAKAVLLSLLIASVVAGFVCTFAAGVMLATLNASTEPVSFWQYLGKVGIPLIGSIIGVFGRFGIRRQMRAANPCPSSSTPVAEKPAAKPDTQARTLTAIATHVDELAAKGETVKARELLDAIDIVTGKSKAATP